MSAPPTRSTSPPPRTNTCCGMSRSMSSQREGAGSRRSRQSSARNRGDDRTVSLATGRRDCLSGSTTRAGSEARTGGVEDLTLWHSVEHQIPRRLKSGEGEGFPQLRHLRRGRCQQEAQASMGGPSRRGRSGRRDALSLHPKPGSGRTRHLYRPERGGHADRRSRMNTAEEINVDVIFRAGAVDPKKWGIPRAMRGPRFDASEDRAHHQDQQSPRRAQGGR